MKCLIVTAEVPYPPASGGSLRVWGILRGLHAAGYDLTLLCCQAGAVPPQLRSIANVITMPVTPRSKWSRIQALFTSFQPDIAKRLYDPRITRAIVDLHRTQRFDLIQFEGIETACYLATTRDEFPRARLVFDTFNAEAVMQRTIANIDAKTPQTWLRALYSLIQSSRIYHYEKKLCRQANLVIAVSEEDAALLNKYRPQKPVVVVSSGLTVSEYASAQPPAREPSTLVFTGKMDYRPNVDAAVWLVREILPLVPNARVQIVGQRPTPQVEALANERVVVTGRVESVLPYLRAATVYVAPLRMGSGTRLKVLEAMACGCAIVATPLAASGLTRDIASIVHIADTAPAFAEAVTQLLQNPTLRENSGQRAQQFVKQHYDWSVIIPRLIEAHQSLLHE